ncbi:MAG TPA: substrate binding domain-containing protein [Polyangiaceae bacterium]|nr:substrate binding domain-containing protein [Polyangiaceae bacterium]
MSVPPIQSDGFRKLIADFVARYPDVRMSLQLSSAYVDLLGAGYDVALRASTRLEPGLVAKTLLRSKLSCVASPAYLAEHGTPKTAADLRHHRCLMGFAKGEIPETEWPLVSGSRLRLSGVFHSNDPGILRELARAGLGVALLPQMMLKADLETGALVEILDGVVGTETRVSVVYAEREFIPAQVRAFIDEITKWAPAELATDAAKQYGRDGPEKKVAKKNESQKKRPAKKESQKNRPAKSPKSSPAPASPARASRERAARSGRTAPGRADTKSVA